MVAGTSEVGEDANVKRQSRCFADEALAKDAADKLAERLSKQGRAAMRLSEAQAIEYMRAQRKTRDHPT